MEIAQDTAKITLLNKTDTSEILPSSKLTNNFKDTSNEEVQIQVGGVQNPQSRSLCLYLPASEVLWPGIIYEVTEKDMQAPYLPRRSCLVMETSETSPLYTQIFT